MKWNPSVLTKKKLITAAALIWVFIKLPQEYWIHIAKLDTTDWIRANPSNALILIAWALFLLGIAWALLRDLPPMKPGFEIAADSLPAAPEGFSGQVREINFPVLNSAERFFNTALVEKNSAGIPLEHNFCPGSSRDTFNQLPAGDRYGHHYNNKHCIEPLACKAWDSLEVYNPGIHSDDHGELRHSPRI
ncbi:hypothetical protein [Methanosarcina barkeri]|uniref:hypothetical protein n=1 Tax=Methanosarcina barkeri TaxID=2208 RepID=UPI000ACCA301|nr:hypothetical protein [Methanosarcina barkeri]